MKPFYNTINLDAKAIAVFSKKNTDQEERILNLMENDKSYSPFDIQKEYERFFPEIPITSIRRAMTNLTKKGLLMKVGMKLERYGKPNHLWRKVVSL